MSISLGDYGSIQWVQKRPVPVSVCFARTSGSIETLEGKVSYVEGDAIITGTHNEQWPVQRQYFQTAYQPASADLLMGQDGCYLPLPQRIAAVQLTETTSITLSDHRGELHAEPGDWLLQYPDGGLGIINHDIFIETYQLIDQHHTH